MKIRPGIIIKWFSDSPEPGPDCACSVCPLPITDKTPIRIYDPGDGTMEARFHDECFKLAYEDIDVEMIRN